MPVICKNNSEAQSVQSPRIHHDLLGVRGTFCSEDKVRKMNTRSISKFKKIFTLLRPERQFLLNVFNENYGLLCHEFRRSACEDLWRRLNHSHQMHELHYDPEADMTFTFQYNRCNLRMICPECGYYVQRERYMNYVTRMKIHVEEKNRKVIPMTYQWKDTKHVMDCNELLTLFRKAYWRRRVNKKTQAKYPVFVDHAIDGFHNYEFTVRGGLIHHHIHIAWIVDADTDETLFTDQASEYWKEVCLTKGVIAETHWEKTFHEWNQWISYLFKNPFHKQTVAMLDERSASYKKTYYLNLLRLEISKRSESKDGHTLKYRLNGFLNHKESPSIPKGKSDGGVFMGHIHEDDVKRIHETFFDDWFKDYDGSRSPYHNSERQNAENMGQIL